MLVLLLLAGRVRFGVRLDAFNAPSGVREAMPERSEREEATSPRALGFLAQVVLAELMLVQNGRGA